MNKIISIAFILLIGLMVLSGCTSTTVEPSTNQQQNQEDVSPEPQQNQQQRVKIKNNKKPNKFQW